MRAQARAHRHLGFQKAQWEDGGVGKAGRRGGGCKLPQGRMTEGEEALGTERDLAKLVQGVIRPQPAPREAVAHDEGGPPVRRQALLLDERVRQNCHGVVSVQQVDVQHIPLPRARWTRQHALEYRETLRKEYR